MRRDVVNLLRMSVRGVCLSAPAGQLPVEPTIYGNNGEVLQREGNPAWPTKAKIVHSC